MELQRNHRLPSGTLAAIATELRQGLRSLYGERLVQLVLFGSQARGDATCGSDIDVAVVLRGGVNPGDEIERTGALAASLSLAHGVVISRVFVPADRFESEQSPLLMNIRREGVLL